VQSVIFIGQTKVWRGNVFFKHIFGDIFYIITQILVMQHFITKNRHKAVLLCPGVTSIPNVFDTKVMDAWH
jgi:hypothetical protein